MLFKVYLRKMNTDMHHKPFEESWEMAVAPVEGSYIFHDGDSKAPSYKVHKVFPTYSLPGKNGPEYDAILLAEQVCMDGVSDKICSSEREFSSEVKAVSAFSGFSDFSKWKAT